MKMTTKIFTVRKPTPPPCPYKPGAAGPGLGARPQPAGQPIHNPRHLGLSAPVLRAADAEFA